MKQFPDTSTMEKSKEGDEFIRGGSIGLNRILSGLVETSTTDRKPRWNVVCLSAFTVFRNVWSMYENPSLETVEQGFVNDVNMFMDYYDTYLSHVWKHSDGNRYCPVLVYFPDYHSVPKEILREHTGKKEALFRLYEKFLAHHGNNNEQAKRLDHSRCFWVSTGKQTYPHKDLGRAVRALSSNSEILYTSGDPVCLMSHILLDFYIATRLQNVNLVESYTGKIKKPDEFKLRLDKEGRVPFSPSVHIALGDDFMIKPAASPKVKKELLEQAVQERWISRSESDIRTRVSKLIGISTQKLGGYDFQ